MSLSHHLLIGSDYHPYYKSILNRAVSSGYQLPSKSCMMLQDRFVRELVAGNVWNCLDFLVILATHGLVGDGANLMFAAINWRQPTLTLQSISTSSSFNVQKKGIYGGTLLSNYRWHQNISGVGLNNASLFGMFGLSSGACTAVESLFVMTDGNGLWTIRQRTNPRVDELLFLTTASPQILQNSLATGGRLYTHDTSSVGGSHNFLYYDGALQSDNGIGAGSSNLTGTNSPLQSGGTISTRPVAMFGGGCSMWGSGGGTHARQNALNAAAQKYMNALNLLP